MKTEGEAMDHTNKFAAEKVRQLQQSLDEVAPYQATELSKQQTICALAPQIFALRSKGYSWTSVAALLSERGVPVSVAALRTYLRRVREEPVHEAPRTSARRSRDGRALARPPQPQPTNPLPSPSGETPPASKPQSPGTAPPSSLAAQHATTGASRREQEPRRSAFTPRPDTHDI